jgi:hypothetical protein
MVFRHPFARRVGLATIPALLLVLALGSAGCTSTTTLHYSAIWQGRMRTLGKVDHPPLDKLAKSATFVGQVFDFQTNDNKYACFVNKSLYVYQDQQDFPGQFVVYSVCASASVGGATSGVTGVWTFQPPTPPTPQAYSYSALFQGRSVDLTYVPNGKLPTGDPLVSQVTQFQTSDPQFSCLESVPIHVWSGQADYPGQYVAYAGCPGRLPGVWTFVVTCTYTATFLTSTISLTPVISVTTTPAAGSTSSGEVTNFDTEDPAYACQTGASLNYYVAPDVLQRLNLSADQTTYVVFGGCLGNAAGVWTFVGPLVLIQPQYQARWKGNLVTLTPLSPVPAGAVALKGQFVTNFTTTDPAYYCFNGASLQVWQLPNVPANELLAYDVCGQVKFGAWTFQTS